MVAQQRLERFDRIGASFGQRSLLPVLTCLVEAETEAKSFRAIQGMGW